MTAVFGGYYSSLKANDSIMIKVRILHIILGLIILVINEWLLFLGKWY